MKVAESSSLLCFLLRPPGGAGSAAKTSARLFVLPSPGEGSDLPADRAQSLEDESSTGGLLVIVNSESWKHKHTDRKIR